MRTLIFLILLPAIGLASNPEKIDLSYSMKGEQIIITWSAQPDVEKYMVESGIDVDNKGDIVYSRLFETSEWKNYQVTYNDKSDKPQTIVYYKVSGLNSSGEVIAETKFTANFISKDKYTLNINPNFFSEILEVEINSNTGGTASITVENMDGTYQNDLKQEVEAGYNNFIIDIEGNRSEKLIVKVDHIDKIQYRMVELKGTSPAIITSDE